MNDELQRDLEDFDAQIAETRRCLEIGYYASARALLHGAIMMTKAMEKHITVTVDVSGFIAGMQAGIAAVQRAIGGCDE